MGRDGVEPTQTHTGTHTARHSIGWNLHVWVSCVVRACSSAGRGNERAKLHADVCVVVWIDTPRNCEVFIYIYIWMCAKYASYTRVRVYITLHITYHSGKHETIVIMNLPTACIMHYRVATMCREASQIAKSLLQKIYKRALQWSFCKIDLTI